VGSIDNIEYKEFLKRNVKRDKRRGRGSVWGGLMSGRGGWRVNGIKE
jgi:hypothetical protein